MFFVDKSLDRFVLSAGPHQHFDDMITDLCQQMKHVCM